jgi:hypothetical protein
MPIEFSDEEKDLLLALTTPIDHRKREQFLLEVTAELEAKRQAGEIGEGSVHRLTRTIQRQYCAPPQLGESRYRRA